MSSTNSESLKSTNQANDFTKSASSQVGQGMETGHENETSIRVPSESISNELLVNESLKIPAVESPARTSDNIENKSAAIKATTVLSNGPLNAETNYELTDEELLEMALMLEAKVKQ